MHPIFHRFHFGFQDHPHHQHATHGGRRGFGGFGRHGFAGDPLEHGLDGLHRGRKLGSVDLQLLLLVLLAERPSHGYELIRALEERSKGYYSPSPGMIYPALTYLEEIGYASVEVQGARKLYSVTIAGLAYLEERRADGDAMLQQLARIGARLDDVRKAMAGFESENFDEVDASQAPHAHERHPAGFREVRAARRALKSALIEKAAAGVEEQRRIAKILERAAAEIRSDSPHVS